MFKILIWILNPGAFGCLCWLSIYFPANRVCRKQPKMIPHTESHNLEVRRGEAKGASGWNVVPTKSLNRLLKWDTWAILSLFELAVSKGEEVKGLLVLGRCCRATKWKLRLMWLTHAVEGQGPLAFVRRICAFAAHSRAFERDMWSNRCRAMWRVDVCNEATSRCGCGSTNLFAINWL